MLVKPGEYSLHKACTNIRDPPHIKKPVYDVLGYTTNLAVKMTALANPNHMVIGQLVYDILDNNQKSSYINVRGVELC